MAKLVYPDISHMMLMDKYLQETFDYGELFINGDGGCHTYQDYTQWLKKEKQNHLGINLDEGYVLSRHILNHRILFTLIILLFYRLKSINLFTLLFHFVLLNIPF